MVKVEGISIWYQKGAKHPFMLKVLLFISSNFYPRNSFSPSKCNKSLKSKDIVLPLLDLLIVTFDHSCNLK